MKKYHELTDKQQKVAVTRCLNELHSYFDHPVRVMALPNLKATCARISGVPRRFNVARLTEKYCYVQYSNPNEYGTERPITAVYPVVTHTTGAVGVLLHMVRCIGGDDLDSQAFDQLETHPQLWRPMNGEGWKTTSEILAAQCAWWGIAVAILFAGYIHIHTLQGEPWRIHDSTEWESYCHTAWRVYR